VNEHEDAPRPEPTDDDDTQPLWQAGPSQEPPAAPASQPEPRPQSQSQPGPQPGSQPQPQPQAGPWPPPSPTRPLPLQPGYGFPAPVWPNAGSNVRPTAGPNTGPNGSGVPGWLWPVVAATALAVGLLGGVLGAVAVSMSLDDGLGSAGVLSSDAGAPEPLAADNGSIAAVAASLLPSTVQILANGGADGQSGGGATGSGFILDGKGHVITNNHVVAAAASAGRIQVIDHAGKAHPAKIVGRSPVYDIAVLEVGSATGLRPAALGSSQHMRVGESVVAIGSPLGLDSTVTSGIISALDRPVTTGNSDESSYINAVQTDAAINPGNSGGPLVNLRGQVIGVNSAIATMGSAFGSETGNIGVGFAIPMEQVRVTATQILRTGKARYPVIGANVNTGDRGDGARVVDVPAGSPADDGGLRKGDVVVAVNGKAVTDGIGLIVAIRSHQPGETITLTVDRDGHREKVRIRLDSKVG
jgi:putative serine protease PepD